MEHFEGILKVLGLVKSTILKLPTASSISRRAGAVCMHIHVLPYVGVCNHYTCTLLASVRNLSVRKNRSA